MTTSLALDAAADVGLGLVGGVVALLDLEGDLVGAAVLRTAQGADGAGDGRVQVGAGAGDDAGGEGGGVELVLRVEDQRGVHRAFTHASDGGLPWSRCRKWAPMESSSVSTSMRSGRCGCSGTSTAACEPKRGHQPVGDVAGAGQVVVVLLRQRRSRGRRRRCASRPSDGRRRAGFRARPSRRRAGRGATSAWPCKPRARRHWAARSWTSRWAISSNSQRSASSRMS